MAAANSVAAAKNGSSVASNSEKHGNISKIVA